LGSGGNTFDYAKRQDPRREAALSGDVYRDGGGQVTVALASASAATASVTKCLKTADQSIGNNTWDLVTWNTDPLPGGNTRAPTAGAWAAGVGVAYLLDALRRETFSSRRLASAAAVRVGRVALHGGKARKQLWAAQGATRLEHHTRG
jgi:hypothetical protein